MGLNLYAYTTFRWCFYLVFRVAWLIGLCLFVAARSWPQFVFHTNTTRKSLLVECMHCFCCFTVWKNQQNDHVLIWNIFVFQFAFILFQVEHFYYGHPQYSYTFFQDGIDGHFHNQLFQYPRNGYQQSFCILPTRPVLLLVPLLSTALPLKHSIANYIGQNAFFATSHIKYTQSFCFTMATAATSVEK